MPHGGRLPGVAGGRSKRDWERQTREREEHNRFQELISDDSGEESVDLDAPPFMNDRLRFTGFDMGKDMQDRRAAVYDDHTYGVDYEDDMDDEEYEQRSAEWQIAMKEKEDELVARAERRMHRARLRGESDVQLTREELDALERKRLRQEGKAVLRPSNNPSSKAVTLARPKKKSGGFLGMGSSYAVSTSKGRKSSSKRTSPRSSGTATPDLILRSESSDVPPGYHATSSGRHGGSPSKRNSRPASAAYIRPAGTPPSGSYDPQARHVSAPDGLRPRSSRGSPTRSLPDEPDWQPRSRASSSTQLHGDDPFAYQIAQGPYMQGRRIVSGPAGVSYSAQRRIAPSGTAARSPPHASSDPALLHRSNSGLSNEIIEISSDEEESDEGVRVDVMPEASSSGYGTIASKEAALTGSRSRRSRR